MKKRNKQIQIVSGLKTSRELFTHNLHLPTTSIENFFNLQNKKFLFEGCKTSVNHTLFSVWTGHCQCLHLPSLCLDQCASRLTEWLSSPSGCQSTGSSSLSHPSQSNHLTKYHLVESEQSLL